MDGQNQCVEGFLTPSSSDQHGRPLTEVMNVERNSQCFIEFPIFSIFEKLLGVKNQYSFIESTHFAAHFSATWAALPRAAAPLPLGYTPGENYFVIFVMDWIQVSFAVTSVTCNRFPVFRSPVINFSTDYK